MNHADSQLFNRKPNIYSGAILSGNKVFASRIEIDEMLSIWRKAIAVEMEAAGIAAALHTLKHPPSFVMVKSVYVFADSTKGDDWQDFAASVAASFVIDYVHIQMKYRLLKLFAITNMIK